jgi:hypothetical protein
LRFAGPMADVTLEMEGNYLATTFLGSDRVFSPGYKNRSGTFRPVFPSGSLALSWQVSRSPRMPMLGVLTFSVRFFFNLIWFRGRIHNLVE